MKKLNFSILTAGNIAGIMASTVSKMSEVNCRAIAARDGVRAAEMASQYGFETSFGSYEELVNDPETDVIYVASPHSHHYEHAKLCLEHGKHVLCEKSFTVNCKQAEEVFALAKEKNLFIMEAVWTRFQPAIKKVKELLDSGIIGQPVSLNVSFCKAISDKERLAKPELAGGALLDLGIYPITFASVMFNTPIKEIVSVVSKSELGVDNQGAYNFLYEDGKVAMLHSSMTSESHNTATITGAKGYIEVDIFWQPETFRVYRAGKSEPEVYNLPFDITGYEYEVRAMCEAIAQGKLECEEMPHAETLRVLGIMDGLRKSWGLVYPGE